MVATSNECANFVQYSSFFTLYCVVVFCLFVFCFVFVYIFFQVHLSFSLEKSSEFERQTQFESDRNPIFGVIISTLKQYTEAVWNYCRKN